MHRSSVTWLAMSIAAAVPQARAEDAPTSASVAIANARAAEANARAAEIDAQAKLMKSRSDALGLNPAKGDTTLGEGAGVMEAWMLSAATMRAAAASINAAVRSSGGPGPRVLLAGDDSFDPSLAVVFEQQVTSVKSRLGSAWTAAGCEGVPASAAVVGTASASAVLAGAGAVLGLLRTDTELRGISLDVRDRALVNTIAGQDPGSWIVPGELVALAKGDAMLASVDELAAARQRLASCRAGRATDKEAAATIDAAIATADDWLDGAVTIGADGQTPLGRAASARRFAKSTVLRVSVEKAGGSLLKRANVWTALGASAVGLTGGLVVSYRLFDPGDGKILRAGLLVCRTRLTSMNAVHANRIKVDAESCSDGR